MIQALRHKMEGLEHLRHLYVHIPFCARICPYCAFYKDRLDRSQTDRFCEAIVAEIALHAANGLIRPSTIFFGGGTPTALSTRQLRGLLQGFREHLDLSRLREWTIEANPGSVSKQKADVLRESASLESASVFNRGTTRSCSFSDANTTRNRPKNHSMFSARPVSITSASI